MTRGEIIATLAAALGPMDGVPALTIDVYLAALADIPERDLERAVRHLIETQEERWWPTVATIRRLVFETRLGLPSPEEAWERILDPDYRKTAPAPVKAALAAVGGSWELRHSNNPGALRTAFIRQYTDARKRTMEQASDESRAALRPAVVRELGNGGDAA